MKQWKATITVLWLGGNNGQEWKLLQECKRC